MANFGKIPSVPWGEKRFLIGTLFLCLGACSAPDPLAESEPMVSESWESSGAVPDIPESSPEEMQSGLQSEPLALPPADEPAPTVGAQMHVIARGDTLMSLARQYYGNAAQWRSILEANLDRIQDPNRIFVGQEIVIPR